VRGTGARKAVRSTTALPRSLSEGGVRVPILVIDKMIGIAVDEKELGRWREIQ